MDTAARVIGVHAVVGAEEPVCLIEMVAGRPITSEDLGRITQQIDGTLEADWQAPYDEHPVDDEGNAVEPLDDLGSALGLRCAFFFHYLDPAMPLRTPWGLLELPAPSPRPARLDAMEYERP